jgi:glycosyltransferase involved in cell wall biosynthesis
VLDESDRRRRFAEFVHTSEVDVVNVEHIGLAPLLPRRHRAGWIVTLHYLSSASARQHAALAESRRYRFLLRRDAASAARLEARIARDYDRVITVSAEDAAGLPGPSTVVPNGVDEQRFTPTPLPTAPRMLFIGRLDFDPNVDGICWFVRTVFPLIRRAVPDATIDVVGRQPLASVRALADLPGVQVRADVEDTRPYLAHARVVVVPLRMGTGTRLKALEAMAAGRPVVGTRVGLAGLNVGHDNAIVADDPDHMAQEICSLFREHERAAQLAVAGRRLVESRYTWEKVGRIFVDTVLEVASARPTRPQDVKAVEPSRKP